MTIVFWLFVAIKLLFIIYILVHFTNWILAIFVHFRSFSFIFVHFRSFSFIFVHFGSFWLISFILVHFGSFR